MRALSIATHGCDFVAFEQLNVYFWLKMGSKVRQDVCSAMSQWVIAQRCGNTLVPQSRLVSLC